MLALNMSSVQEKIFDDGDFKLMQTNANLFHCREHNFKELKQLNNIGKVIMVVTAQFQPKAVLLRIPFPLDQKDCCNKGMFWVLVGPLVISHKQFQPEHIRNSFETDWKHEEEVGKNECCTSQQKTGMLIRRQRSDLQGNFWAYPGYRDLI